MNPTEKLNELRHERIKVIARYKRGGATAYETELMSDEKLRIGAK